MAEIAAAWSSQLLGARCNRPRNNPALIFWHPTHLLLTILLPLCFTYTYVIARRRYCNAKTFIALPMLIGLWTLGGLFMSVSASFSGGGFASPGGLRDAFLLILLSFLPPYTFMMATYNGTLFGLLLATVAPLFAGVLPKPK